MKSIIHGMKIKKNGDDKGGVNACHIEKKNLAYRPVDIKINSKIEFIKEN